MLCLVSMIRSVNKCIGKEMVYAVSVSAKNPESTCCQSQTVSYSKYLSNIPNNYLFTDLITPVKLAPPAKLTKPSQVFCKSILLVAHVAFAQLSFV